MVKIPGSRTIARLIFVVAAISLCVFFVQAQETKKKMTKKDLPPAVLTAFEKEYSHPGSQPQRCAGKAGGTDPRCA